MNKEKKISEFNKTCFIKFSLYSTFTNWKNYIIPIVVMISSLILWVDIIKITQDPSTSSPTYYEFLIKALNSFLAFSFTYLIALFIMNVKKTIRNNFSILASSGVKKPILIYYNLIISLMILLLSVGIADFLAPLIISLYLNSDLYKIFERWSFWKDILLMLFRAFSAGFIIASILIFVNNQKTSKILFFILPVALFSIFSLILSKWKPTDDVQLYFFTGSAIISTLVNNSLNFYFIKKMDWIL